MVCSEKQRNELLRSNWSRTHSQNQIGSAPGLYRRPATESPRPDHYRSGHKSKNRKARWAFQKPPPRNFRQNRSEREKSETWGQDLSWRRPPSLPKEGFGLPLPHHRP